MITDRFLSALAYELSTSLYDPEVVFRNHGISSEYFARFICYNPAFMAFYAEARAVWNASDNSMHRFTKKAGILMEAWLDEAYRLLHDVNSPMAAKVTLVQWLGRVAGAENVHPPVRNASGDGGVATQTVVINLAHGTQREHRPSIVLDNRVTDAPVLPQEVIPGPPTPPHVAMPTQPQMPPMGLPPFVQDVATPISTLPYPAAPMAQPAPVRSADSKPAGEFTWPGGPARFPPKPIVGG
jgi:hypothetical protein